MNDLFTKSEISLILFIFVGLAGGFAAGNLDRQGSSLFPEEVAHEVPSCGIQAEPSVASTIAPGVVRPSAPVDINRAAKAELESLDGIGPTLADSNYRGQGSKRPL